MINNAFISRIKLKARSNQLAIVTGSAFSGDLAIPSLAEKIKKEFGIEFRQKNKYEYYCQWNQFIDTVEKKTDREEIWKYVKKCVESFEVQEIHRKIACIPISNFVDITFDRGLTKALSEVGKNPIIHAFSHQSMGSWRQSVPEQPNIFLSFVDLSSFNSLFGLHEQLCSNPQNRIQIENMMEMVRQKDLLLLGLSSYEAEGILQLPYLAQAADKVVNTIDLFNDYKYWAKRGVYIADIPTETIINELLPHDLKSYTFWDIPFPNRMLIDITKEKEYDCFISYFTGDQAFARKIESDLRLRNIHTWRDQTEIDVGDSMSDKIQEGLTTCYTFIIILTKEALERPWVKEELRAAYNLRLGEDLKILPVLYKDCEIPVFLIDYRYADFREAKNYSEQIELLSRSINNAVKKARKKK